MALLLKSTAYTRNFKMIDSADHFSKKTGLTCTVNICKSGGSFATSTNAVSEIANGWYKLTLTTTETNTPGDLLYYITASGADDTDFMDQVTDPTVAFFGANTVQVGGTVQTARDLGTSVLLSVGTGTGQVNLSSGAVPVTSNVKKNQALAKFGFLMTDSTNHAPVTGKTVTATRSIDGAAFGAGTLGTPTEVANGMYYVDLGAGDLNGNVIILQFTAASSDTTFERIITQS